MKIFFPFYVLVLFASANISIAQTTVQDIVYLKDGSIYRGAVKEQYPDSIVKMEITGGNIIVISASEVRAIEYKVVAGDRGAEKKYKEQKSRGYFNISEAGLMPGYNYNSYYGYYPSSPTGITLQTIHGYRFNSHWLAGGGLGLDIVQQPLVQLFGDARWEILNKRATPFIFVDAGYGFSIASPPKDDYSETKYRGGMTWGSGIGMKIRFRNDGAFLMSAGYKMDKRTEEITTDWQPFTTKNEYTYNRMAIRFGLEF